MDHLMRQALREQTNTVRNRRHIDTAGCHSDGLLQRNAARGSRGSPRSSRRNGWCHGRRSRWRRPHAISPVHMRRGTESLRRRDLTRWGLLECSRWRSDSSTPLIGHLNTSITQSLSLRTNERLKRNNASIGVCRSICSINTSSWDKRSRTGMIRRRRACEHNRTRRRSINVLLENDLSCTILLDIDGDNLRRSCCISSPDNCIWLSSQSKLITSLHHI